MALLTNGRGVSDEERKTIISKIDEIVDDYRSHREWSTEAYRPAQMRRRVEDIKDAALHLAYLLNDCDMRTLEFLKGEHLLRGALYNLAGEGLPMFRNDFYVSDYYFSATGDVVGQIDDANLAEEKNRWVPRLRALAALAKNGLKASAGEFGKDLGGNRNMFDSKFGSPKWTLARDSGFLFWESRGKITGSSDGPFGKFLKTVHDYATGNEPNDANADLDFAGLDHYTKQVAKIVKSRMADVEKYSDWSQVVANHQRLGIITQATMDNLEKATRRLSSYTGLPPTRK